MAVKQIIAIIGATGNMGSALAKSLARGPYRVLLFAKDAAELATLEAEIRTAQPAAEVEAIGCPVDASWEADIIIPVVPYQAQQEVAEKIRQVATGKVVISITNPLNETNSGVLTAPYSSAAEELQKLLPHSKVVKAFNTINAEDFALSVSWRRQAEAFIAGNDEEAVDTVTELVRTAGFTPTVVGELSVSRTLESLSYSDDLELEPLLAGSVVDN
jgi:8-hydroxy-5-deazaflavin:NADPH oxidoreductase